MSKSQHIIVLTNYNLWYYEVEGDHASRKLQLELPVEDLLELNQFFSVSKPQPVRVLINIYEEEFFFADIPHVNSLDRKRIIERKLDQQFKNCELKRYVYQGRRNDGRKDDVVMLSGVRDADLLDQLLDYLFERKVPVEGVYSTQSMIRQYLQPIVANRDVLVMTEIDNGHSQRVAVRQSFYKGGHLKLSRVANIYVNNEETLRDDIQEELNSSRLYLLREHYIDDDAKLPVVFVHSTDYLSALSRMPNCMGEAFVLEHVSTAGLGEILNLSIDNEDVKFEDISAVGASKIKGSAYTMDKTRYYLKHRHLRNGLKWASAAAAILFCALSVNLFFAANKVNEEYKIRLAATENLQRQTVERREMVNTLEEDINQIQVAVDLVDDVERENIDIDQLFFQVGNAFGQYPKLMLTKLDWRESTTAVGKAKGDSGVDPAENYDYSYEEDEDEELEEDGYDGDSEKLITKSVTLTASPLEYGKNVRQMMKDVDGLVERLRESKNIVEVDVTKYPLNLDQDHVLRGRFAGSEYLSFSADSSFEMELVFSNEEG